MIKLISGFFRKILSKNVYKKIRNIYFSIMILLVGVSHRKLIDKIRKKNKIRVAFLVFDESVWKCKGVYDLFAKSGRYEPYILICPIINLSKEESKLKTESCFRYFSEKDYEVYLAETSTEKLEKSDIVFFTNPHNITKPEYYSKLFFKKICCYVPYSHQISFYDNNYAQYDRPFHNLMWKIFAPQEQETKVFEEYSVNKGRNVVVSGYPGVEILMDEVDAPSVWKSQRTGVKKKVIWAPHHTIQNGKLKFSNFYSQAELILKLSDKYKKEIQWCFKPHPLLFNNLIKDGVWSKSKVLSFYNSWQDSDYRQTELGDYVEIFKQSDAMIHDSGSFLAEYLYTNKPVLHLAEDEKVKDYLNEFGIECYNVCSKNKKGNTAIEPFLNEVIRGFDRQMDVRKKFVDSIKKRYFHSGSTPSLLIFNYIDEHINNN
ncbi:TPA: CDP-glycerol glycerophosphotransferase family protein [Vibrio vulnificus]|nr:CDP-glycerol glycerophosphotransferase family protein [Vibrio vulnificus]